MGVDLELEKRAVSDIRVCEGENGEVRSEGAGGRAWWF